MLNTDIPSTLVKAFPKDLVMGVHDGLMAGASRGYTRAKHDNAGHKKTILGYMRNWCMNEEFHTVLTANGCEPTPLRGNNLVVGKHGIFNIGRINDNNVAWNNLTRSKTRRELASHNRFIEALVQPGLFDEPGTIPTATVFFLARFSGSLSIQPESPLSIELVVPSSNMKYWLFHEPLELFLTRYDVAPSQSDNAFTRLKAGIGKKDGTEEDDV